MNVPALNIVANPLVNIEAEQYLVAALLYDNGMVDRVADRLSSEDFGDLFLSRVYSAIVQEVSGGRVANPVTLKTILQSDPDFDAAGGLSYLVGLAGSGAFYGVQDIAADIIQLSAKRRLVEGLRATIETASDPSPEVKVADLIDSADAAIVGAVDVREGMHQPTGAECIAEVLSGFDEPWGGVRSGKIGSLDDLTGPLKPKQLVIMAGRPGMGKTAVAVSYAIGAAQQGYGTLFVSLEMGSTELGARMAADLCHNINGGVPFENIRDNNVKPFERKLIMEARDNIKSAPLRVIDTGKITLSRLAMMARRYKRHMAAQGQSLDLLIVDYLQLVHPDGKARSAYEAVSEVSRGLKQIAKDLNITVLALAQLSRSVEQREDKRPMLSDLRDSGQIEQDADSVIFLYREEYYLQRDKPKEEYGQKAETWISMMQAASNKIDFILAKRRNGRVGDSWGYFFAEYQAVRGNDFYKLEGM